MDNARPHTSSKKRDLQTVNESLSRLLGRADDFDYFINIQGDIKRPPPIPREKTQPCFQSTPIKSKANADLVKRDPKRPPPIQRETTQPSSEESDVQAANECFTKMKDMVNHTLNLISSEERDVQAISGSMRKLKDMSEYTNWILQSDKKRPPPIQRENTQPVCEQRPPQLPGNGTVQSGKKRPQPIQRETQPGFQSPPRKPEAFADVLNLQGDKKRPPPIQREKTQPIQGDKKRPPPIQREKTQPDNVERDDRPSVRARRIDTDNIRRLNYNTIANETRIVLIGRTGSGKSATGNSILGYEKFKSCFSGSSMTKKCQIGITYRDGCNILVVDTPGMFDTDMTNKRVLQEVVKCVGLSAPGPHAFILVVRLGRYTTEEKKTVLLFIKHFGVEILQYMIILFTGGDELKTSEKSLKGFIDKSPIFLRRLLQRCDNRCVAFDNRNTRYENHRQVYKLLGIIDNMTLRNAKPYYTNPIYEITEDSIKVLIETERRKMRAEQEREMSELLDQRCKPLCNTIKKNREDIINLQRQQTNMEKQRKQEQEQLQEEQTEPHITREQLQKHQEQIAIERNRQQKSIAELERLEKKNKNYLFLLDLQRNKEKRIIQKQKGQTQTHEPSDYELRSMVRNKIEKEDKNILTSLGNALSGAGKGALSGATIGLSVAGPIGAPIGAVIGGVVGFFKGLFD